jgi:hypothetical protein
MENLHTKAIGKTSHKASRYRTFSFVALVQLIRCQLFISLRQSNDLRKNEKIPVLHQGFKKVLVLLVARKNT